MKFTYNWLKDFVDVKIPAKNLADKLTMAGLEVGSLEEKSGDFIFEIEITSNRPDWLSVVGIAREVAAVTNSKFNPSTQSGLKAGACLGLTLGEVECVKIQKFKKTQSPFKIEIEDKKDCLLYTAKIIKNVKVAPSPDWLKKRLELIGCRTINNIVDITNYILFTYGEPLHAFDLDKLNSQKIIVRRARHGEKLQTIDGKERILDPGILVVAGQDKAVALAGIMGGKDSEVTEKTEDILLEAAIFNPVLIRRSRQKLGIQTDSSYRFERGIDQLTAQCASLEALKLIQALCGGECILCKDSGKKTLKKKTLNFDAKKIDTILGIEIKDHKIKEILQHLGFFVKIKNKNKLAVDIPAYRQDVNLEVDLLEEIARIFGYEHIPTTVPLIKPRLDIGLRENLTSLIKNTLVGLGLNEVITCSLIDKDMLKDFAYPSSDIVEIANPLSKEQEILRPTLLPSLMQCIAYNLNQKQNHVNIFEVAKVFSGQSQGLPREELVLALAFSGEKTTLLSSGRIKEEIGLMHLKGVLEVLLQRLGITEYSFNLEAVSMVSLSVRREKAGSIRQIEKQILDDFEIKNRVVVTAEIYLEKILPHVNLKKKFVPLAVYPGVTRDISLILKKEVKVEDVFKIIKERAQALLRELNVVDFYQGKQVPQGYKGLTISCLYRSDERTLTEEEVNPVHSSVVSALIEKLGAQIR